MLVIVPVAAAVVTADIVLEEYEMICHVSVVAEFSASVTVAPAPTVNTVDVELLGYEPEFEKSAAVTVMLVVAVFVIDRRSPWTNPPVIAVDVV
jgi:hypothetical protein